MHIGNWSQTPEPLGWESNEITTGLSTLVTEKFTLSPLFTSLRSYSCKKTFKQGEVPLPPTHWEKPLGRTVAGSVVINLTTRGIPPPVCPRCPCSGGLLSPLMTYRTSWRSHQREATLLVGRPISLGVHGTLGTTVFIVGLLFASFRAAW